jgi:hypothetical protein
MGAIRATTSLFCVKLMVPAFAVPTVRAARGAKLAPAGQIQAPRPNAAKILQQRNLFVGEGPYFMAVNR